MARKRDEARTDDGGQAMKRLPEVWYPLASEIGAKPAYRVWLAWKVAYEQVKTGLELGILHPDPDPRSDFRPVEAVSDKLATIARLAGELVGVLNDAQDSAALRTMLRHSALTSPRAAASVEDARNADQDSSATLDRVSADLVAVKEWAAQAAARPRGESWLRQQPRFLVAQLAQVFHELDREVGTGTGSPFVRVANIAAEAAGLGDVHAVIKGMRERGELGPPRKLTRRAKKQG